MMLEMQEGTVRKIIQFFGNTFLINLIFILVVFLLELSQPGISMMFYSVGLWPLVFTELVIECNKEPDMPRK